MVVCSRAAVAKARRRDAVISDETSVVELRARHLSDDSTESM